MNHYQICIICEIFDYHSLILSRSSLDRRFEGPQRQAHANDGEGSNDGKTSPQGYRVDGSDIKVEFSCSKPLLSASLLANFGRGHTVDREWKESPAGLTGMGDGKWTVTATLPSGVSGWFVNVKTAGSDTDVDGDGLTDRFGYNDTRVIASSDYQEVKP